MHKRELVYLHALLGEVRHYLDEHEELPPRHFDDYEEYGVGPTAIHRTKGEHAVAVRLLLDGLVAGVRAIEVDGDSETESITPR